MEGGEIQDEQHAIFKCGICDDLRNEYINLFQAADMENMRGFWQGNVNDVSAFIRRCLILYESAYQTE
jgi:DNA-binding NtrC family response regulator